MRQHLRPALVAILLFTLLTGAAYPAVVTLVGQLLFPRQAAGSLIEKDGRTLGSALIGQSFSDSKYFWGRLSATGPVPYNASASSGSNLGPSNPALVDQVKGRLAALHASDSTNQTPVPVDLVTASASGLDPDISPAAAAWQLPRVARVRGLTVEQVTTLVSSATSGRSFGILGEPRVNVLQLNLALDSLKPSP
ncbi:MAG: potassium-transporting ATPase subunit KdpC [Gemmatimonadota bacterium]